MQHAQHAHTDICMYSLYNEERSDGFSEKERLAGAIVGDQ